jgi:pilus assembly protein CpaF
MFGKKTVSDTSLPATQATQPAGNKAPGLFATKDEERGSKGQIGLFFSDAKLQTKEYLTAKAQLNSALVGRVDFSSLEGLPDEAKKLRIRDACDRLIAQEIRIPLTAAQMTLLKDQAVNDLLGFGPLEILMADPDISDIMINGSQQVYVETGGKIVLTDIRFANEKHLLNIIQKIVSIVGRRIDESSPMVDARMPDGSRFNAIIPPLALDGCLVSIRKFRKSKFALRDYVAVGSMSNEMATFLEICGLIRLNIIVSGGTGSGKTTLLNALSGNIDHGERVVTIEDAAELQLQQPHVLRMETRPPNMEGVGEVTQRQLVKNALRMRPDRIIIGEIRGEEVIDVLSAMNTGHDGSMATIHANTPRDALSRIENLVGMSAVQLAMSSLRTQIASAVHLIVQVARQRDGRRRVVQIDEVSGLDGDTLVTTPLFVFKPGAMGDDGILQGQYHCTGAKPRFLTQAAYFGKEEEMLASLQTT